MIDIIILTVITILFMTYIICQKSQQPYKQVQKLSMETTGTQGHITSLYLHPEVSGQTIAFTQRFLCFKWTINKNNNMRSVSKMTLVANKGIVGNTRYYDTLNKSTGYPNRNHISLIEIERIAEHARKIGLAEIKPGQLLSNIETCGINLMDLVDCEVKIGDHVVLYFYKFRVPCYRMDQIAPGLHKQMKKNQGIIAEVITGGEIKVGDVIRINDSIDPIICNAT